MQKNINIGLIQMTCTVDSISNLDKTITLIKNAANKGANIICTQELFKTPYFCQTEDYSNFKLGEYIDENNETIRTLSNLAKKLKIVIIASLFENRAEGLYHNTAVVLDADGAYLGKYRKMHIPDDPHYYEKFYFSPGDLGYKVFKTKYATLGVLICWDQWYPEAARLTALRGAQILFYPTAIGWLPSDKIKFGTQQHNAWETIQRSHSVANGCFVASINRVGFEASPDHNEGIEFWGQSFVSDTSGKILQKASSDKEELLVVPIDLAEIENTRVHWPFFRDRRISSYEYITKKYID